MNIDRSGNVDWRRFMAWILLLLLFGVNAISDSNIPYLLWLLAVSALVSFGSVKSQYNPKLTVGSLLIIDSPVVVVVVVVWKLY